MASDRYHNIFMRHRSRSPIDISEEQYSYALERELEDNVTKALINLLEYARGSVLLEFLRLCKVEPSCPLEEYEIALHEDIGSQGMLPAESSRFLIELVPGKRELKDATSELARTDEPIQDARIQSRNEVCFFEVKIRGEVLPSQRQSYLSAYSIPEGNIRSLSWDDVHSSLSGLLPRDTCINNTWLSVSGFLLAQFLEFLETLGLSSFAGIRQEHFQILKKGIGEILPEERARLKWLQGTYSSAITAVIAKKDSPRLERATEYVHIGNITRHEPVPWIAFSDQEGSSKKTQSTHFGSSLHAYYVKVYVSCEGKQAYSRFLNICQVAPEKMADVTSRLKGYQLAIRGREQLQAQRFKYLPDALKTLDCPLDSDALTGVVESWDGWFGSKEIYPGVFLEKVLDKAYVIDRGIHVASDAVDAMEEMQPYRDLVNDWKTKAASNK